jgi:C-terminal processing protease CtpA/Prc
MRRVIFLGFLMVMLAGPAYAQVFQTVMVPPGQAAPPAGIGAVLLTRNGVPVINEVIPHSPAANAGLKPQDTIVWVNYRDVAGMKLEDVVGLIRGDSGSSVTITVLRPGDPKPHSYTMTRAPIVIGP